MPILDWPLICTIYTYKYIYILYLFIFLFFYLFIFSFFHLFIYLYYIYIFLIDISHTQHRAHRRCPEALHVREPLGAELWRGSLQRLRRQPGTKRFYEAAWCHPIPLQCEAPAR
jgi:uncharacterized protein (DUF58 family)